MTLATELVGEGLLSENQRAAASAEWEKLPATSRPSFVPYLLKVYPDLQERGKKRTIERLEKARAESVSPQVQTILRDIRDGNTALLVGAGFSMTQDAAGQTVGLTGEDVKRRLADAIAAKHPDGSGDLAQQLVQLPLGQVALSYEREFGRASLHALLARACHERLPMRPPQQHRLLARLNCFPFIITTNWDPLIEQAYEDRFLSPENQGSRAEAQRNPLRVINDDRHIPGTDLAGVNLLKLHGDISRARDGWNVDPIVTNDDFHTFAEKRAATYNLLRTIFVSQRVVIVGFHPSDYTLSRLLTFMQESVPNSGKNPIVVNVDELATLGFPAWRPDHVKMDALKFLGLVHGYIENQGSEVGSAYRKRPKVAERKHVGLAKIWAKDKCNLAERICEQYGVRRVEVVGPTGQGDSQTVLRLTAGRGARVLRELMAPGGSLALSCGATLKQVIEHIDPHAGEFRDCRVYSTNIPVTDECDATSSAALVTMFASQLAHWGVKGHSFQLPSKLAQLLAGESLRTFLPPCSGSGPAADLVGEPVHSYLERAGEADVIMLGLGGVNGDGTTLSRYALECLKACRGFNPDRSDLRTTAQRFIDKLVATERYVGDLMYRFFARPNQHSGPAKRVRDMFMSDASIEACLQNDGREPRSELFKEFVVRLSSHALSIDPEHLLKATRDESRSVVVAVSGAAKAPALQALLESGIGDTFIIGQDLAMALLNNSD